MEEIQSQEYVHEPELNEQLDALMNKGNYYLTPFTCGVGLSADGLRYAAVGIKLHGNSRYRKGAWTRTAIAASVPVEQGLEALVPKLRKLYANYANQPHRNVNTFRKRRKNPRALGGRR
jgi:hypothetical protein